jgi:hypothetical protein
MLNLGNFPGNIGIPDFAWMMAPATQENGFSQIMFYP